MPKNGLVLRLITCLEKIIIITCKYNASHNCTFEEPINNKAVLGVKIQLVGYLFTFKTGKKPLFLKNLP
jgi:hypothetical protein